MGTATANTTVVPGVTYPYGYGYTLNLPVYTVNSVTFSGFSGCAPDASTTSVTTATYTSGITAVGAAGTTCSLSGFNNGSTATGYVTLTGTNAIAGGTPITINYGGLNATAAPTSATATTGSATSCSGTAVLTSTLGAGIYLLIPDIPPAQYGVLLQSNTDTNYSELVDNQVGTVCGIQNSNGANTFWGRTHTT